MILWEGIIEQKFKHEIKAPKKIITFIAERSTMKTIYWKFPIQRVLHERDS